MCVYICIYIYIYVYAYVVIYIYKHINIISVFVLRTLGVRGIKDPRGKSACGDSS